MFDLLDKIREEHEATLEKANNNKIKRTLFSFDLIIVLIDLLSNPCDDLFNLLLGVEYFEVETFVTDDFWHWQQLIIILMYDTKI